MFYKIIKIIFELFLFIFLLIVIISVLPINFPLKSYVVVSGSMEPAIQTGSLVFSQSLNINNIKKGDIIAFLSPKNQQTVIIHRISQVSNNGLIYTKGDNNNSVDDWQINKNNIIGKTFFIIPNVGKFVNLVHTPVGFILIIAFPALIFIILQSLSIKAALSQIENKKIINILLLFFISLLLINPNKILAIFTDTVPLSDITITVDNFKDILLSSEIISAQLEDQKIKIQYTSSTSDFTNLKICYSHNLSSWQCFLTDKSGIFNVPQGDGIYYLNTLIGKYGQFEDKVYTQHPFYFQVDQTPPTSSLNLEKTFINTPYFLSHPLYNFDSISLNPNNLSSSINFSLPQKNSAVLSFKYFGQSSSTCDFSHLKVSLNGQTILQTGPQEIGLGNWVDNSGLKSFFYQLPVFPTDQDINLSFTLSDSSSIDTVFTISDIKIYPISIRTANTFVPSIDSHDIGSGVGDTHVSLVDNKVVFYSSDILDNQESSQSVNVFSLPPVVLNKITIESIDLYKNTETDLSGYYFSNLLGQTYPVVASHNSIPNNFINNGLINLNNSAGYIIDKFNFDPFQNTILHWRRSQNGIGTWVSVNQSSANLVATFETDRNTNKLLMTISNISSSFGQNSSDYISYTINYQNTSGSKQIHGKIRSGSVENNKVDREFDLGSSIKQTINLAIEGQINGLNVNKKTWQVTY